MRGIPGAMTPRTHSGWVTTACWHIWAETLLWNSSTADRIRCSLAFTSTTGTEPQVRDRTRDRPYGHESGFSGVAAGENIHRCAGRFRQAHDQRNPRVVWRPRHIFLASCAGSGDPAV